MCQNPQSEGCRLQAPAVVCRKVGPSDCQQRPTGLNWFLFISSQGHIMNSLVVRETQKLSFCVSLSIRKSKGRKMQLEKTWAALIDQNSLINSKVDHSSKGQTDRETALYSFCVAYCEFNSGCLLALGSENVENQSTCWSPALYLKLKSSQFYLYSAKSL